MSRRIRVNPGDRYGRLTVIKEVEPKLSPTNGRPYRQIQCKCECGTEVVTNLETARQGNVVSCGCSKTTHGQTKSLTYTSWVHMRHRCHNPKGTSYSYYGGRGISVCERWNDFAKFLADMRERPSRAHTVERIDNNGNYEPGNCCWATRSQQAQNSRQCQYFTFNGESHCLAELARLLGMNKYTLRSRLIKSGGSVEKAIATPVGQYSDRTRAALQKGWK